MHFVTTAFATQIIQEHAKDFGVEYLFYEDTLGRILAEDLFADRDWPPFNRTAVDGIAIDFDAYEHGQRSFTVKALQAAGEHPVLLSDKGQCIEVMTGAALHNSMDTVIPYEDIRIQNGLATIQAEIVKRGQHLHLQGADKKRGDRVAEAGAIVTPALMGVAASIGKTKLSVKKLPRVVVITTGDEMVDALENPTAYQLRRSNGVVIKAVLETFNIKADTIHLKDDSVLMREVLSRCLREYDVLLMSGGVSMGKFDYVPAVLESLQVKKLFHKVKQRPGKPFWFGAYETACLIFAFPGNPVSAFMCLHRYFIPWLKTSLGGVADRQEYALLQNDIHFSKPLQYFVQVKLKDNAEGRLWAVPVMTNGSGDFSHLLHTDAFMELPLEENTFSKGTAYRIWRYTI